MKMPYGKGLLIAFWALILFVQSVAAQSAVEAFSATYTATPDGVVVYAGTPAANTVTFRDCALQASNYKFHDGNQNVRLLTNVVVNGRVYMATNHTPVIKLRRVNNPAVSGNRSILFFESATAPAISCPSSQLYSFKLPYQDQMETALNRNYINQGTDNIFANTGNEDGNNNNIERVDVVFPSGLSTSSINESGFALFERGNNNTHDPFRIAAITAIDASGNPTAFGLVRTCMPGNGTSNGSWGHPSLESGNQSLSVYVMRKDEGESQLQASAAINQQLGGVFFSLQDLGVTANQIIYGYTLLAADGLANPTSEQLLDLSDQSVYPLNTNDVYGGGLDLVAVTAFFQPPVVLNGHEVHLKGSWQGEKAVLQWTLKELPANSYATLQGSENGSEFNTVQSFVVSGTYHTNSYTEAIKNFLYYRLKIETPDKQLIYSKTIQVKGNYQEVQLYPTRIQPSQSVRIKGVPDGLYTALISSTLGSTYVSSVKVQNGIGLIEPPRASFAKGLYYVTLRGADGIEGGAKLVVY
jgi:hypothetical protein